MVAPLEVSKLTDREGSFAQKLLQAISYEIYKDISLPEELRCVWETLAPPEDRTKVKIDSKQLNFFSVSDNWLTKRIDSLISEIDIILSVSKTDYIKTGKVKSHRYLPTLKQIPSEQTQDMNDWLSKYKIWLSQAPNHPVHPSTAKAPVGGKAIERALERRANRQQKAQREL